MSEVGIQASFIQIKWAKWASASFIQIKWERGRRANKTRKNRRALDLYKKAIRNGQTDLQRFIPIPVVSFHYFVGARETTDFVVLSRETTDFVLSRETTDFVLYSRRDPIE